MHEQTGFAQHAAQRTLGHVDLGRDHASGTPHGGRVLGVRDAGALEVHRLAQGVAQDAADAAVAPLLLCAAAALLWWPQNLPVNAPKPASR